MKEIFLYTDGSSLGNPGAGGYCGILKYKDAQRIISGGEENTTNNRMELKAVIESLKVLKEPCKVNLYSDSKYVVDAIGGWIFGWIKKNFKGVKNPDLWQEFLEVSKIHKVEANWIKAHNGHFENEQCDSIAKSEAEKFI
jgi:ribonuclease HI